MRRIPSQVPQAVSRLLQGNVLQQPPTWYIPVISNPPPVLPPRQTVKRLRPTNPNNEEGVDMAYIPQGELENRDRLRKYKQRKNKIEKINYNLEDKIRRQFFKDFQFEALRPISLVENQDIDQSTKINGEDWVKLEQRGQYPTVEDTIEFVINILQTRQIPISDAYSIATKQFIELRARHEQATIAAEIEARYYGAEFKPDAFERQFNLEEKSLSTLIPPSTRSSESSKIKYRKLPRWQWSNSIPSSLSSNSGNNEFTGGERYIQNWKLPEPLELPSTQNESVDSTNELLSGIPQNQIPLDEQQQQQQAQKGDQEDDLAFLTNILSKSRS